MSNGGRRIAINELRGERAGEGESSDHDGMNHSCQATETHKLTSMEKAEGTELSRMLADETMIESFMLLVSMITKVMKGRSGASNT